MIFAIPEIVPQKVCFFGRARSEELQVSDWKKCADGREGAEERDAVAEKKAKVEK